MDGEQEVVFAPTWGVKTMTGYIQHLPRRTTVRGDFSLKCDDVLKPTVALKVSELRAAL